MNLLFLRRFGSTLVVWGRFNNSHLANGFNWEPSLSEEPIEVDGNTSRQKGGGII